MWNIFNWFLFAFLFDSSRVINLWHTICYEIVTRYKNNCYKTNIVKNVLNYYSISFEDSLKYLTYFSRVIQLWVFRQQKSI